MRKRRFVLVLWDDSCAANGWTHNGDALPTCVKSIGWVLSDYPDSITICSHIADEGTDNEHYHSPMTIPKLVVKEIKDVRIPA